MRAFNVSSARRPRQSEEREVRYFALFSAAGLAGLAVFSAEAPDRLGFGAQLFPLLGLAALFGAGYLFLGYIGSVYKFWKIDDRPNDKPFVFIMRAIGLIALALLEYIGLAAFLPHDVRQVIAITIASGGAYDLFVFYRAQVFARQKRKIAEEAEQLSGLLDTGHLATEEEKQERGLFERGGFYLGIDERRTVFAPKAVHAITYGEPGSGKGTGTVVPNLMNWRGSAFVTDPKGELAAMTADYRRDQLGQEIVYFNPWGLHGLPNTPFNPLQLILDGMVASRSSESGAKRRSRWGEQASAMGVDHGARREIADAEALARLIYPEPPGDDGKNKWVRDNARRMLKAFILYLASDHPQMCNLVALRQVIGFPDDEMETALLEMESSEAFGNELRRDAQTILNTFENTREQFEYARDDAARSLGIYDSYSHLGKAVSGKGIGMRDLVRKPTTIYLIIPSQYKESHAAWMGLITMNVLEAVGRYGNKDTPTLCMLDEFANLGKLPNIRTALAEYRGKGLRGWLIVQNRDQLETVYGKTEARALEGLCSVEQYLSVKYDHAKELSERIGQKAVKLTTTGRPPDFDPDHPDVNISDTEQLVPVLPPRKITELGQEQLVFIDGLPMLLEKSAYWRLSPWNRHVRDNPLEGSPPAVPPEEIIHVG